MVRILVYTVYICILYIYICGNTNCLFVVLCTVDDGGFSGAGGAKFTSKDFKITIEQEIQ